MNPHTPNFIDDFLTEIDAPLKKHFLTKWQQQTIFNAYAVQLQKHGLPASETDIDERLTKAMGEPVRLAHLSQAAAVWFIARIHEAERTERRRTYKNKLDPDRHN